jgi:hypothetical protein|tara:strand:- start:305188 stop:305379 length:192 start_codon:yes stop_codon:yes gene_type:complete
MSTARGNLATTLGMIHYDDFFSHSGHFGISFCDVNIKLTFQAIPLSILEVKKGQTLKIVVDAY